MCSKTGTSVFRTVTFRLTLWYAALLAALSLAAFATVYVTLTLGLHGRADEQLLNNAKEFEALYQAHGVEALKAEFEREAESDGVKRVFFRLLSPQGEVLAASDLEAWGGLDEQSILQTELASGQETFLTLSLPGHAHKARAVYSKLHHGNILQIGYSLQEDEQLIGRYRQIFTAAIGAMLIFSTIVGWFVAKRAMAGVERVTRTAMRIREGEFAHRVPLGKEGQEIERLASAFNDMLERIQSLVSELKEVTNSIAHDLRSPISRIRIVAETALSGAKGTAEYREAVGMVVEECDRLVGMINTMLEIAETDAGVATLKRTPVDVAVIARDAYDLFEPAAEDKGVRLELDIPPEAFVVTGDVGRLQRAIANLLDNAIKYTASGGSVRLTVRGNSMDAKVSVSDTGVGIGEQDLPHIFERFYRADPSRSLAGNGLGLSLARTIVRAHGGEITVTSSPGKGSTFTILLPRTSGRKQEQIVTKR